MFSRSRAGIVLLAIGALTLIGWMGYALTYNGRGDGSSSGRGGNGVIEVAVFLPERSDWEDFRLGVAACLGRGLVRDVEETPGAVSFRTLDEGRVVRLNWRGGGGVGATRTRVRELVEGANPPLAIVGSNNTVLTAALAESLRGALPEGPDGPALLVPWATSVAVERPGGAMSPMLGIYPGRSFRFCPNNRQEAELVASVVAEHAGAPSRVVMVVDGGDPYSRDLAEGFEDALAAFAPDAEVLRSVLDLSGPVPNALEDRPGALEIAEADRIWRVAAEAPEGGPVWALLPLQGSPARRLIRALVDRSGPIGPRLLGRLHVLCGDGIGRETLEALVGRCTLPVWCVSSGTAPRTDGSPAEADPQIPSEIVAALARIFDRPAGSSAAPAALLSKLDLAADAPGAFGRSLAFAPDGERRGPDLGHVLAIRPGLDDVLAFEPSATSATGLRPEGPSLSMALWGSRQ